LNLRGCEESSVKKTKFTEAQIAFVLKQAEDGAAIAEVRKRIVADLSLDKAMLQDVLSKKL
jgi:putative transposase